VLIKKLVKYKNWSIPSLGGLGWTEEYAASCLEFTHEEIHLYELWFEFMKRSTYSRWTEGVKRDFLNISRRSRAAHIDVDFQEWWEQHNLHFAIAAPTWVHEVKNDEDYRYFQEVIDEPELNVKMFAVFMDAPISIVKRQFAEILRMHRTHTGSRVIRRECDGGYPLYGANTARYLPDVQMLWKILDVYDLKNYYDSQGIRRFGWQIEEELSERRINSEEPEFITREPRLRVESSPSTPGGVTLVKYSWDELRKERRKVQATTISRYFRQAETIIANVELGVFPKWTK